ncbi:MAG: permease [Clostridiales bacterium]|jgi:uncharacterized membrane protein YraQ (UPF0718 family)|nr:permease [Clostridiales bacterium]
MQKKADKKNKEKPYLTLGRFKWVLVVLLIDAIVLLVDFPRGETSCQKAIEGFANVFKILPPIFILLGLLNSWVSRETFAKYMGKRANAWLGGGIAFLLGALSAGPLYASFPVIASFKQKGVAPRNLYLLLGAWATCRLPLLLVESTYLGVKFAALRVGLSAVGVVIIAFILERVNA